MIMETLLIEKYEQSEGKKMAELLECLGFKDSGVLKVITGPHKRWPNFVINFDDKSFYCGYIGVLGGTNTLCSMMDALGVILDQYLLHPTPKFKWQKDTYTPVNIVEADPGAII